MQVVRELFSLLKIVKWRTGEYAWVIYLQIGDNPPKGELIPDNIYKISVLKIKGGLYT